MVYRHAEDVKSALRKRYGSVAAFERLKGLPTLSVRDVLRGRSRPTIAAAVAEELAITAEELKISKKSSHNRDNSMSSAISHPQNAASRASGDASARSFHHNAQADAGIAQKQQAVGGSRGQES